MKKGEFSYANVRALSHASLQKFRQQSQQSKLQSINKDFFPSKPNIKYCTNSTENVAISTKLDYKKMQGYLKNEEELKKKIKQLECSLKKKISQHSYLIKLFKTKNSSQVSHLDIYLEFQKIEQEIQNKNQKIKQLASLNQEYSKQIESLLTAKESQDLRHVDEVKLFYEKVQKLQKKQKGQMLEKDRLISEQKKLKQEKDLLLKQIRKKYEQSQNTIQSLEQQLVQVNKTKQNIQSTYEQRMINTKQNLSLKIQQNNHEIQMYKIKIKQQEEIINNNHEKYAEKNKQYQINIKKLQGEFNQIKFQLEEKCQNLLNIKQKYKSLEETNFSDAEQIAILKKQLKDQENYHQQQNDEKLKQFNLFRQTIKDYQVRCDVYMKEISKLQQKINEASSTIKVLNIQREDKDMGFDKVSTLLIQKQKILQDKQKLIEELQAKCFASQRKTSLLNEKSKQLEKQLLANKEFNNCKLKLEIENYKCIGRITQLVNQLHGFNSQVNQPPLQSMLMNKIKMCSNKNNKYRNSEQQQNAQTITECVDILTRELEYFIKTVYQENVEAVKQNKELIQEIICDVKGILHAYNSVVQDNELKNATKQYMQCLQNVERSSKKQRNSYLQVIMEKLFSIIAIQCYTSENGIIRKSDSKTKLSRRKNYDSLQNTCSNLEVSNDQKNGYSDKGIIHREDLNVKGDEEERPKKHRDNKKKNSNKMYTQPYQIEVYPIRKLEYGKQNLMQKMNKPETQITKCCNYKSHEEPMQSYNRQAMQKQIKKERKVDSSENVHAKDMRRDKKMIVVDGADAIQKKYFR